MGLYSVFDVFEAKGVIHETGSSVDAHRLTLCCKGGLYSVFRFLARGGLYMRGVISELLGYYPPHNKWCYLLMVCLTSFPNIIVQLQKTIRRYMYIFY